MPLLLGYIDYYEVEIKPFEQQVYKGDGFKPAQLVGYGRCLPLREIGYHELMTLQMAFPQAQHFVWRKTAKLLSDSSIMARRAYLCIFMAHTVGTSFSRLVVKLTRHRPRAV